MPPPIPPVADASPSASFFTPAVARGISAVLIVLGAFYFLHRLARRGTRFISEELRDTKKVYHDAFAAGILDFQLNSDDSDRALDREVEDEASTLRISFLAASPLLLPFMQLVSLVSIARCAYNIRVFKKKIQNPPPRDEIVQSLPRVTRNDKPDAENNAMKRSQPCTPRR
ncbi:hypothetical protein B0H17DRAFT_1143227 [Mycena rosella]|uniref:Uncharacterized protein n=1 Tax=Mycena rosella TaxID=1033263 RepID=A0AAD7CVF1_MYCRO|nr:hypothetical protein B0H17DRAFT_1143227 [Mycena rosella]